MSTMRENIYYCSRRKKYQEFSNFSPHAVEYKGKRYPTSEHLFQAMKFLDQHPEIAEHIRTHSEKPAVAKSEGRKNQKHVRSDWFDVSLQLMEEVLREKFTQHTTLKAELLATVDAELIEDAPSDPFWGSGRDKKGRNEMGKALMRVRDQLRP